MDVKKIYDRAEAAINLKKYDLAVSLMKDIISCHPDYSYAYYITAKAYFWAGDYDSSEEYIRQALSFYATNNEYLTRFSATLAFNEKFEEALENINNVLASEPTCSLAIYYKAYCLYKMEEYNRAENILSWYLEYYPNDDVAHCVLGGIYQGLGKLEFAEKEFQEALRINPNNAITFNNFAVFLQDNKNYEKALELFKEAIRLAPADKLIESNLKNLIKENSKNYKFCLLYKTFYDEWQIPSFIGTILSCYICFFKIYNLSIFKFSNIEIVVIISILVLLAIFWILYKFIIRYLKIYDD